MLADYIECTEVFGKTIRSLRIFRNTGDGHELQIDLTDGTSFTCCFNSKPKIDANVIRPGVGEPVVLRKYDID